MEASREQAILRPDSAEGLDVGFLSTTFSKSHFQPGLPHPAWASPSFRELSLPDSSSGPPSLGSEFLAPEGPGQWLS